MKNLFRVLTVLGIFLWFILLYFREPNSTIALTWSTLNQPIIVSTFMASAFALLIFVVVYVVLRLLAMIWRIPKTLAARRDKKTWVKGANGLRSALIHLAEGNYAKAERLSAGVFPDQESLVHHWVGARAAAGLDRSALRDQHIEEAIAKNSEATKAMRLEQIRLMIEASQFDEALALLNNQEIQALNIPLELRYNAEIGAQSYEAAMRTLQQRFNQKQIKLDALETQFLSHGPAVFASKADAEDLRTYYAGLHKQLRKSKAVNLRYLLQLCTKNPGTAGLTEIESAINDSVDASLVDAYCAMDVEPVRKLKVMAVLADKNKLNHQVVDHYIQLLIDQGSEQLQSELEKAANQAEPSSFAIKTLLNRHIKSGENDAAIALLQRLV